MQHYKMRTRLLDWTDGSLLALYFAVSNLRKTAVPSDKPTNETQADAAVWVLDPSWLNSKSKALYKWYIAVPEAKEVQSWLPKDPFRYRGLPPNPVAIDPPHFLARISAQRSHFTLFGNKKNGLTSLSKKDNKARLIKIIISNADISKIRDQLEICGITETSVFPDLEGVGRELTAD